MRSPGWAAKRKAYFRSGMPRTCQGRVDGRRCGAERVQLHHWTYDRLGRERLDDLVPLCESCHERVHDLAVKGAGIKAATKLVCGSDILGAQQKTLLEVRAARRERRAIRPAAAPAPRMVPLRAEASPAPSSLSLTDQLEAFGAAIRRGESGKTFERRRAYLSSAARRAKREDIALAVERYEPRPVRAGAKVKPWDTSSIRLMRRRVGRKVHAGR